MHASEADSDLPSQALWDESRRALASMRNEISALRGELERVTIAPSPSPAATWDVETTAEEIARILSEVKGGRIHGPAYNAAKAGALEAFKRVIASLAQGGDGARLSPNPVDDTREPVPAAIGAGGQAIIHLDPSGQAVASTERKRELARYLINVASKRLRDMDGFAVDDPMMIEAAGMLSAISHPVQPGWRDIASAPRDGTRILVIGHRGAHSDIAEWGNGRFLGRVKGYERGWRYIPGRTIEPTHWMPLPAAPQPQEPA